MMNYNQTVEQVDKICEAIREGGGSSTQVEAMVSNKWNNTTSYQPGDYVIYNNVLYKCLVATVPGVTPTPGTYWTIETVGNSLTTLNDTLTTQGESISKSTNGVGAISVSKVGTYENTSFSTTAWGTIISFTTNVKNTNENVFTSADGSGCLIKQKGVYSVRVRVHGLVQANDSVYFRIRRYQSSQDVLQPFKEVVNGSTTRQFTIDETIIMRFDGNGNDRFIVEAYSGNANSFYYGTRDAGDTILEVIKLANIS